MIYIYILFFKFSFNWSIISLQCVVQLCESARSVHIPLPLESPTTHPIPLLQVVTQHRVSFLCHTATSHSVQFSCSVMSNSLRPQNCSTPGLPVHHQLPEITQTHVHRVGDAIQPSHPLSSPSPPAPKSLPASGSFPMSQLFA